MWTSAANFQGLVLFLGMKKKTKIRIQAMYKTILSLLFTAEEFPPIFCPKCRPFSAISKEKGTQFPMVDEFMPTLSAANQSLLYAKSWLNNAARTRDSPHNIWHKGCSK